MKNCLFLLLVLSFVACGSNYSRTKIYEFSIENHLKDKTIKISPLKPSSMFWISTNEYYLVPPGEKIIIGSKIIENKEKKATDIYNPEEIIEPFDLYIDSVKTEEIFSLRGCLNLIILFC